MLILIGASASGKTEIAKELINNYNMNKMITYTTREKRENEINGIDYHFISEAKFLELKSQNFFIETSIYNHTYYGTSFKQAKDDKVLIVDINGANNINKHNINSNIYVYLHTLENIREERMAERNDKPSDIKKRLIMDKKVFDENLLDKIDLKVDTSNHTTKELAKTIYEFYIKKIRELL
ncbi:AAA family ATPase [Candidatus Izimaplasma bacterium ZiA1]|uniref:AAA family ATPase n=1 Tax=Candidatus Izimoplasma sp. ZiA1 TaxID=2024899 RepID=UPI0014389980